VQTETFVIFSGNKIKFFSAVPIFGSRSMVALVIDQCSSTFCDRGTPDILLRLSWNPR